ncbi:MAG: B12-binding domain-containing radical SAM protein [Candidatus Thorarchaeota archaeon]
MHFFAAMSDKVLIIDALSSGSGLRQSSRDAIGCGPRAIAGVFENKRIECRIIRAEDFLSRKGRIQGFEHTAVSAMTMDFPAVQEITKRWRRLRPRGKIVLGGPIASEPILALKELKPDVLVIGEGEETLIELLELDFLEERISLDDVKGIGHIQAGKPILTQKRPFLSSAELSERFVPSVIRIIDYPVYQASKVYVEVLRGCSNFRRTTLPLPDGRNCSDCSNCDSSQPEDRADCPEDIPPGCGFCSVPGTWGPPRSKTIDSIVSEIRDLLVLDVHRIVLEAPGFLDYMRGEEPLTDACNPPANINAISDLIRRISELRQIDEGSAHLSIENMKACLFTEPVAQALSSVLKSTSPNIGLETGSEEHMRSIGKCGTPSDVLRAVRLAKQYDMTPFVYLIYGLPGETPYTVQASITLMQELSDAGAERIILYGFRPLPGSAFADFPLPLPNDAQTKFLREEVARINRERKHDYVGLTLKGIAAEPSWARHGYTMVYPLEEGPIMTVRGGYSAGTILNVRISEVLSPGLLEGDVVTEES